MSALSVVNDINSRYRNGEHGITVCGLLSATASEGVLGRRSAPAWLCESTLQATSEGMQETAFQEMKDTMSINNETVEVEALEEGGSSNESLTGVEKGRTGKQRMCVHVCVCVCTCVFVCVLTSCVCMCVILYEPYYIRSYNFTHMC